MPINKYLDCYYLIFYSTIYSYSIPNWSEVPITLTGCEQRCFCENGELDCQEVCTPLPPIPPQTMRCPPQHRPSPVNISDDDCCKQWACVPHPGKIMFYYIEKSWCTRRGQGIKYLTSQCINSQHRLLHRWQMEVRFW